MSDEPKVKSDIPPGSLAILAGVMALVSLFLMWLSVETGPADADNGYKAIDLATLRYLVVALGILLLLFGLMRSALASKGRGSLSGVGGVLVALLLTILAGFCVAQPGQALGSLGSSEAAADYSVKKGRNISDVLGDLEDQGLINVKPELGAMLALGAGVIGIAGAGLQLTRDRKTRRVGTEGAETRDLPASSD